LELVVLFHLEETFLETMVMLQVLIQYHLPVVEVEALIMLDVVLFQTTMVVLVVLVVVAVVGIDPNLTAEVQEIHHQQLPHKVKMEVMVLRFQQHVLVVVAVAQEEQVQILLQMPDLQQQLLPLQVEQE
tara:strand:+ start:12 stop:398 length:387 start_codon:yes stop_codon:yes gene_type:complete